MAVAKSPEENAALPLALASSAMDRSELKSKGFWGFCDRKKKKKGVYFVDVDWGRVRN